MIVKTIYDRYFVKQLKKYKPPLRYVGGKSRDSKYNIRHFPNNIKEYREPFLGGGSVALEFTKQNPNLPVWVNDKYYYLYNFWLQLQKESISLTEDILTLKQKHNTQDKARDLFNRCQENISKVDNIKQAVYFYIINKCSFSGLGQNSSFSAGASDLNFSQQGIYKLPTYSKIIQNWNITNLDYSELLNDSTKSFVFLDPPYDIKSFIYGGKGGTMHRNFTHDTFAQDCYKSNKKWLITYNSNDTIKKLFEKYNMKEWDMTYTMRSTGSYTEEQSKRKELLITNYKIKLYNEQLSLFNEN